VAITTPTATAPTESTTSTAAPSLTLHAPGSTPTRSAEQQVSVGLITAAAGLSGVQARSEDQGHTQCTSTQGTQREGNGLPRAGCTVLCLSRGAFEVGGYRLVLICVTGDALLSSLSVRICFG
jgi:hypothetical protein